MAFKPSQLESEIASTTIIVLGSCIFFSSLHALTQNLVITLHRDMFKLISNLIVDSIPCGFRKKTLSGLNCSVTVGTCTLITLSEEYSALR